MRVRDQSERVRGRSDWSERVSLREMFKDEKERERERERDVYYFNHRLIKIYIYIYIFFLLS